MNLLKIKNNLYRKKLFWLIRQWVQEKPVFTFWAQIFRVNHNYNNAKSSASLLRTTLWPFIKTLAYAVFIVALFETYNWAWPVDTDIYGTEATDALLTTIASVSGVFLGLYFTAISGIASNFLLRATQSIRRYFLSTPIGNQFVQTVAITGIVSIFYLTAKSFGHPIHPVGLAFLSILAAYIIIRFWWVGSNVFYSLEPTSSMPHVIKNIYDYLRDITPPGFKWNKPAIQNHYRRLTIDSLELIEDLNDFGVRELKLSDEQLIISLRHLSDLLYVYSDIKRKVPTDSFWYKTRNQFENWALADSTKITLALHTGTTLSPKIIKDFTWFEEQTLDIALKNLKLFVKDGKIGSAYQGLEAFVEVAEVYAKDFDEAALKLLLDKMEAITDAVYAIQIDGEENQSHKEQLAFVDTQGRLVIAAALGLSKYLDGQTVQGLLEKISKIKWVSESGIYVADLPYAMIPNLEATARELKNELVIEGKIHSPAWYMQTLSVRSYLFALQKYFNFIKSLHEYYFQPKFEKLITTKQLSLAVQLLQRWLEFTNKYQRLVHLLEKHIEECAPHHKVLDLSWPAFDFDAEVKITSDREKGVVDKLVQLLPKLKDLATGDDLPDYFGQALTLGLEACYEACEDNDPERLQKTLPVVLDASLAAHEKVRATVQNWAQEDSKIVYSTEPLINLLEISGFTRMYSELYGNPELWNVVERLWDAYLANIDAPRVIQFIVAMVKYRNTLFMVMPQDQLRMKWKMIFEQKLRERGFPVFPNSGSYDYVSRNTRPDHQSPLIRIMVGAGGAMMYSISEVFFATYLSSHINATGIDFPDRNELKKRIEREQQESESNENKNE